MAITAIICSNFGENLAKLSYFIESDLQTFSPAVPNLEIHQKGGDFPFKMVEIC
jgi:hypothetical protein